MTKKIIKNIISNLPFKKDAGYLYFNIDESKGIRQIDTLDISGSYNFLFCTPEQAKRFQLI